MKKQDFLFIFVLVIIFLPFFVSESIYNWYKSFNAAHGMVMSFVKFGILATLGEMLGLRISAGVYNRKGFGVLPRAVVWGLLGNGYQCGHDNLLQRCAAIYGIYGNGKCRRHYKRRILPGQIMDSPRHFSCYEYHFRSGIHDIP